MFKNIDNYHLLILWLDEGWNLGSEREQQLLRKLYSKGIALNEYVKDKIFYGIKTGLNEAFVIDEATKNVLVQQDSRSQEIIKPFLFGRDIKRYEPPKSHKYLILFPRGFTNTKGSLPKNPWKWIKDNYTAISNHLEPFEEKGKKRYDKGDYWWELRSCDYYTDFEKTKIMFAEIATKGQFQLDENNHFSDTTSYIISTDSKYLLAILNSNLTTFLFSKLSSTIRGGFLRWKSQYVKNIPIKNITTPSDKEIADKIVNFAALILSLNNEKQQTTLPEKLEQLQGRINHTDDKINKLVYELYGLTEEEIKIVES